MTDAQKEEFFVADLDASGGSESPIQTPTETRPEKVTSLGRDAWLEMRRKPSFWISAALIVLFMLMAIFPQLFSQTDPYYADLSKSRQPPQPGAPFGYDNQGHSVYARTIYGARASIMVGIFATIFTLVVGSIFGIVAGYVGGWLDSVLGRTSEIFLGIPALLGGMLFLYVFPSDPLTTPFSVQVAKVALVIGVGT